MNKKKVEKREIMPPITLYIYHLFQNRNLP